VGKTIYLIFSADSLFEGTELVLNTLRKHNVKGSFFLTGNCLRMTEHHDAIRDMLSSGHYVGAHSDAHILYADWDKERTNLVSDDSLQIDLHRNYEELARFGVAKKDALYFLTPYEWYNRQNTDAIRQMGLIPINFSTGLLTSDDYTTPDMGVRYRSSQQLIDLIYEYEAQNTLNGCIMLVHVGTSPKRTDKLYNRLGEIIVSLKKMGYRFDRFR
jgi:peptidoglycan/xylan/chitin deacetylase (PgdA/CDA1 family)